MAHKSLINLGLFTLALTATGQVAAADSETQTRVERLERQVQTLEKQLNATADMLDNSNLGQGASKTHVGGYGEIHYNNLESDDGSTEKQEIDFHRFVLFFGYDFNDKIRLHSELEVEHAIAGEGQNGEVELEQAYIEFDLAKQTRALGGLFLVPVGILNETHEPTTFYGVERNPVEKNILPVTWWEGGAMLSGAFGGSGVSYDLALHSGLSAGTDVRGGRQKVSEAKANDPALTARLKYTGIAGLELAATVQSQGDMTQDSTDAIDGALLIETHALWNKGPFSARALYTRWDIDGADAKAAEKDIQEGYYVEGAYKIVSQVGVFARYNAWDNGGAGDTERTQVNVGANYWPHEDVVIKFDVQQQDGGDAVAKNSLYDGFNIGLGYAF